TVEMPGFRTGVFTLNYDANQPSMYRFLLSVGGVTETVEVSAAAPQLQTGANEYHGNGSPFGGPAANGREMTTLTPLAPGVANQNIASANVMNLQRRVAGVLPG